MVTQRCPLCGKVAYMAGGICEFCGKGGSHSSHERTQQKRFRIAFSALGHPEGEIHVDTWVDVKEVITKKRRRDPGFLSGENRDGVPHDITIEDSKEGLKYFVDQDYTLVLKLLD